MRSPSLLSARVLRATLLAVALVLPTAATTQATTLRIPFSGTSTLIDVPSFGTEKDLGDMAHVRGMVLVYQEVTGNPMLDGVITVTVSYNIDGATGNGQMWGEETLSPTAYPGEGYTCSMSGGWDAGVMTAHDRCIGFGPHLRGWQFRSLIERESAISGYLFRPGD